MRFSALRRAVLSCSDRNNTRVLQLNDFKRRNALGHDMLKALQAELRPGLQTKTRIKTNVIEQFVNLAKCGLFVLSLDLDQKRGRKGFLGRT